MRLGLLRTASPAGTSTWMRRGGLELEIGITIRMPNRLSFRELLETTRAGCSSRISFPTAGEKSTYQSSPRLGRWGSGLSGGLTAGPPARQRRSRRSGCVRFPPLGRRRGRPWLLPRNLPKTRRVPTGRQMCCWNAAYSQFVRRPVLVMQQVVGARVVGEPLRAPVPLQHGAPLMGDVADEGRRGG